ncbi:MAG: tripartite tricarboxylate transporter substrate binding protein [Burkholderiales bacterium]|nr:tripartite tricarboxylate transporter substrate binding protein [Burkholderiales bacterium]
MTQRVIVAVAMLLCAGAALAQTYPAKPIRIIVPFPAGGGADLWARLIGQKLAQAWGHNVIVDNRSGASGIIGTEASAKAAADGYTLLLGTTGTHTTNPVVFAKLPYDPVKDFAPLTNFVDTPFMLVVHPSLPAVSVKDVVALAKRNPAQATYASFGNGSSAHLAGELFKSAAAIDIVHVPYRGGAPAMADLMGGQVSMMFNSLPAVIPQVKAHRLRPIAIASSIRTKGLPEVPTFAEGGLPAVEAGSWYGVFAPAGTPSAVIGKLNAELVRMLQSAEIQQRLVVEGADAIGNTPEQFAAQVERDIAKWSKVARASGIRLD